MIKKYQNPYLKNTTIEVVKPKTPIKIKYGKVDKLKIWKLWKILYYYL